MDLTDVLIRIVPLALAGALSPINASIVIVMLLSEEQPIARAFAFIAGFVAALFIIGSLIVGIVSTLNVPPLRPASYAIILVLGVLLILLGLRQIVVRTDADEPPAAWMEKVVKLRPLGAFGVGFLFSTLGLKNLTIYVTCLGIITTASLTVLEESATIFLVILLMISSMLFPVFVYLREPERGKTNLGRMRKWMLERQHTVAGAVMVLAGIMVIVLALQTLT